MTRSEKLAQIEARAKTKLATQRERLAQVQAAQRHEERKTQAKRHYQVGQLADAAGLLALSDADLAGLFTLLAPLTQVPDPVAVLESLLGDAAGAHAEGRGWQRPPPASVVSALRAD